MSARKNPTSPYYLLLKYSAAVLFLAGCNTPKADNGLEDAKDYNGPALFSLTNAEETGLYFVNEVTESNQLNILTYEYTYNGAGVAIGDVNNDDLPDVFFSGNLFGGRLFLNKGDLKFEQISETAGVFQQGWSTGVSMVDINGDGYDDIYICRSLASDPELRRNVLLVNNQDNTFTDRAAEYGLDDPSFSHYASFFDYDRDGDLDMYLLNHRIDFKEALKLKYTTNAAGKKVKYEDTEVEYVTDKLYRNNGNGSFTDVTVAAGLVNRAFGLSVTTADINKDGWPDIYVGNDYADKDQVYLNNGDGTFTDKVDDMLYHMSKNTMGADIADYNNDGLPDIISLDMMAEDNLRQKQLKGQDPYDLYYAAVDYGLGHQVMRNTLQLNNGNGTFSEIGQLAGVSHTDWSWSPLFADFDNDGHKDLFISNGLYRDLTDLDYRNYTSPQAVNRFGGDVAGHALELTQLIPSNPVPNYVYQNNGDLSFTKRTKDWGLEKAAFSNGAVYADMDGDGDLDLITNNFNSEAFLYQNNTVELGLESNYLSITLKGSPANPDGVGSKITLKTPQGLQYQELSPYRGYLSSGQALAHFGLGKARQVTSLTVEWPTGEVQQLSNVAANQRLELSIDNARAKATEERRDTSPLLSPVDDNITGSFSYTEDAFNDFKREPLLEHQISNKGPFAAKADVNDDGREDLYLSGAAGSAGVLYMQDAHGEFKELVQASFAADAGYEDTKPLFFDFDGDGDQDLFVASGGYAFNSSSAKYQNRLYLNNGEGLFTKTKAVLPNAFHNSTGALALDFDSDGDLDLFVSSGALPNAYPMAAKSQLLINEGGSLKETSDKLPNDGKLGMINDALWLDIDNDQKPELILAGEWMPITVLSWNGSSFEAKAVKGLEKSSGWWNVLAAADMDGDGDLDLIGGNRGENSFYKASENRPATIYAKDFDQNSQVDAFPFYYFSDGISHPKHTLSEMANQYPAIRRKFTRYAPYSTATLDDVFSRQDLDGAEVLKAETFSTTYFENLGNGSFKPQALPKSAQFSEVHGILPIDLNKDGQLDLILTGNNYGADVEMGRIDASIGTVLLGNGPGGYAAVSAAESGFAVPGDTRGMVQVGDQVYVLVNGDRPYSFTLKPHN